MHIAAFLENSWKFRHQQGYDDHALTIAEIGLHICQKSFQSDALIKTKICDKKCCRRIVNFIIAKLTVFHNPVKSLILHVK